MKVKKYPTEYQECKMFWESLDLFPGHKENWIKHCNERVGSNWYLFALKAIGLQKGIPDYQYCKKNEKYCGLWIEMKRINQKNVKKREEQNSWIERLNKNGFYACYAYGANEAIQIFLDYVNNKL